MPKNAQMTAQMHSFHMLVRLRSKSFKPGFSSMWTENFQMFKVGLENSEEPEIKLPTFARSWRKQRNSRKTSTSASMTTLKPLAVWITTNSGKFLKTLEYQTISPISWETCMQVKKLELDMEQWTGSKLGKKYVKAIYCHPAYLTSMQSIMRNVRLTEAQAGIKIAGRNINNLRYADDTTLTAGTKELLDDSERGEWKSWLKTQHSEN